MERGAVRAAACLGKQGSSTPCQTRWPPAPRCTRFNALHQTLMRVTIYISKTVKLSLFIVRFMWVLNNVFKSERDGVSVHERLFQGQLGTGCSLVFN